MTTQPRLTDSATLLFKRDLHGTLHTKPASTRVQINTWGSAMAWAVSQYIDTTKNTKGWAVSQHTDTSKNTKAWDVTTH